MRNPDMRDLLHSTQSAAVKRDPAVAIDSEEYSAIGCDLRNIRRLERLLKSVVDLDQASILCIAEDSTTFMPVKAADALICWSALLSNGQYFLPWDAPLWQWYLQSLIFYQMSHFAWSNLVVLINPTILSQRR